MSEGMSESKESLGAIRLRLHPAGTSTSCSKTPGGEARDSCHVRVFAPESGSKTLGQMKELVDWLSEPQAGGSSAFILAGDRGGLVSGFAAPSSPPGQCY